MSRILHLIPIAACEEIGAEVETETEESVGEEVVDASVPWRDASAGDESGTLLLST